MDTITHDQIAQDCEQEDLVAPSGWVPNSLELTRQGKAVVDATKYCCEGVDTIGPMPDCSQPGPPTLVGPTIAKPGVEPIDLATNRDGILRSCIRDRFSRQCNKPLHLEDVDDARLCALQRVAIVSDGTLSRLLEALVLEPIKVVVLGNSSDGWKDLKNSFSFRETGATTRRLCVLRGSVSDVSYVVARSFLSTTFFPAEIIETLPNISAGIGEAIAQLRIETYRELLWFGRVAHEDLHAPEASLAAGDILVRSYRIFHQGRPIIWICESFLTDLETCPTPK